MSVYINVHISMYATCVYMCEMTEGYLLKCLYIYMQIGVYITLFAYVHV